VFLGYNFGIMKRYWPLLVIVAILAAVIGVSQYAESAKEHCEESTRQVKATSVAKGNDGNASDDAEDACKPPVWARYCTWPEGVGAWAVILTLFAIAWQSIETRAAAQATQSQVEAMDTQNRNSRDRDRARFTTWNIDRPELLSSARFSEDTENSVPVRIRMQLVNDGGEGSKAFNIIGLGCMKIVARFDEGAKPNPDDWFNLQLQGTFRGSGTENRLTVCVTTLAGITDSDYILVSESLLESVQRRQMHIEVGGLITYDDVFGDHHETPFRFLWVQEGGDRGGDWWDSSHWVNYSGKSR